MPSSTCLVTSLYLLNDALSIASIRKFANPNGIVVTGLGRKPRPWRRLSSQAVAFLLCYTATLANATEICALNELFSPLEPRTPSIDAARDDQIGIH